MELEQGAPALARLRLNAAQREAIARLLALLERDEHAPTAVRDPAQALGRHVADSLVALELAQLRDAGVIADLGSGAGFPGLALAIALPRARVSLVESNARRCEFLRSAARAAGAGNARVVCSRAEEWREGLGVNDAVLARALASQAVVLEYAAPLLREGGTLIDWRGRRDAAGESAAARAAAELGMALLEVRRVEPHAGAGERHLHVFAKRAPTPERFPRRAGMAAKRPLGR